MAKQDQYVRITLRLPPDLHQALSEAAGPGSLNAYIINALEERIEYETRITRPGQMDIFNENREFSVKFMSNESIFKDYIEETIKKSVAEGLERAIDDINLKLNRPD